MDWMLPPGVTSFAGDIDRIYYGILIVTAIAFVVVEAGLIWFLIKYRARPGRVAHYTHGSLKAEVIWTAIPAITVVAIGVVSGRLWSQIKGHDSIPADALQFAIHAKQFEWNVRYAGPDGQLETGDDFTIRNQLHVPVNQPVALTLDSEDVIHSFNVHAFRVKQDAVPGMKIRVWFTATQPGEYELACAELCGMGHYKMRAVVTVHTEESYRQWQSSRTVALRQD